MFNHTHQVDGPIYYTYFTTRVGKVLLTARHNQLTGLYLEGQKHLPTIGNAWQPNGTMPLFKEVKLQLDAYFNLERYSFTIDYKLNGTGLQMHTWKSLVRIPYGEVWSYKALAALTPYPNAVRAVASAIGKNPLSIIVPCHRVIRSDGSLGGYAGGIAIKKELLRLEGMR